MHILKALPIAACVIAAKLAWGAFVVVGGLYLCSLLFDLFFWIL